MPLDSGIGGAVVDRCARVHADVDSDYKVPFRFTGKIDKLTYKLGLPQLTEADRAIMHAHIIKAKD